MFTVGVLFSLIHHQEVSCLTEPCHVVYQRIQYAKTDSEVITKMKGVHGDKEKKKEKKKKLQEPAANLPKKTVPVSEGSVSTQVYMLMLMKTT